MPKKSLLRVYIYGIINTYSASAICMENTQYVRDWILSTYIHSHFDEEIIQSKHIFVIRSYKIDILIHRQSFRRKLWYSAFWIDQAWARVNSSNITPFGLVQYWFFAIHTFTALLKYLYSLFSKHFYHTYIECFCLFNGPVRFWSRLEGVAHVLHIPKKIIRIIPT